MAERHRIPPAAFDSEHPLPRFDNVAREVGLDFFGLAGGAIVEDFDNDGRLDVMTSSQGFEDQTRFFWNDGGGSFVDRTEAAGLTGEVGGLNMVHADYDNDGFVDVLVLRGGWLGTEGRFPPSLVRNLGDGTFSNVTRAAGLLTFAPTQTATWLDYDGDGRLNLFLGNESGPGDEHPWQLFHNEGDGTFEDVTKAANLHKVVLAMGLNFGDLDNDGWLDFYAGTGTPELTTLVPNRMFRNDGAGAFQDVTTAGNFGHLQKGHGIAFGDVDNDGDQDVFSQMGGAYPADRAYSALYENPGNGNHWLTLELADVQPRERQGRRPLRRLQARRTS